GQAVLLNGSELSGGLCPDYVARAEEHVADHVTGALESGPAGVLADGDGFVFEISNLGGELERRLTLEEVVPVLFEQRELGEILFLPADNGVVVFLINGSCCIVWHRCRPASCYGSARPKALLDLHFLSYRTFVRIVKCKIAAWPGPV